MIEVWGFYIIDFLNTSKNAQYNIEATLYHCAIKGENAVESFVSFLLFVYMSATESKNKSKSKISFHVPVNNEQKCDYI